MSTKVNVYLSFDGTCEAALAFYASVFRIEIESLFRYEDEKELAPFITTEADKKKIMHASLPLTPGMDLMGDDRVAGVGCGSDLVAGNNSVLSVFTDTEEEAKRIFSELSAGGEITMPLEKTFWNALFGTFTDKFGILWNVNYNYE